MYWIPYGANPILLVVKDEIKLSAKIGRYGYQKFVCKDFDEYFLNLNKSGFRQEKGLAIQNRLIDGVAMVPIKSYCEALGAEVTWKNDTEYISCPEEKLTSNRDRDFLPYYLQMAVNAFDAHTAGGASHAAGDSGAEGRNL